MYLKSYSLGNGVQMHCLVDENWIPVDWRVSTFITTELFLSNQAENTFLRRVKELKFILEWFESKSINLIARFQSGELLKYEELRAFISATKSRKNQEAKVVSLSNYKSPKQQFGVQFPQKIVVKRTSVNTTNGRLDTAVKFFDYLYRISHQGIPPDSLQRRFGELLFDLRESRLRRSKAASQKQVFDGRNSVIPDDVLFKVQQLTRSDHPHNPFGQSAFRNQLIIDLLISTGIRVGALMKLKISDLKFEGEPFIRVTRTPYDASDPRKDKPQQKTLPHPVPISRELAEDIETYINTYRNTHVNALHHDFLFTTSVNSAHSKAGSPLTIKTVNSICQKISKVINYDIHPHLFRHKWNELWTAAAERLGLNDEQTEKRRIDAMGWSPNSEMPLRYNKYKHYQKVQEIMKEMQEARVGGLNDEK